MFLHRSLQLTGILMMFLLAALDVKAQEAAESITVDEVKTEDTYLAGRTIHIVNKINGDLVAAAQKVIIEGGVTQDVNAAGERVTIRTKIGDDARLAGRSIHIDGTIGDDLIATGDTITVDPDSTIGGRVWAAGRSVELSGSIGKDIKIAAQDLTISSVVSGNVEFTGERINILPGARIEGNLSYRSQNKPQISAEAHIEGDIIKKAEIPEVDSTLPVVLFLGILFLSLLLSVAVMHWIFPKVAAHATEKMRVEPLKCLGLGLVIWLLMPVTALILMITVIGIPLGLILIAVYPVILFTGFAISIHYLGQKVLTLLGREKMTNALLMVASIAIGLILFTLVVIIPIVGTVLVCLLLLGGLGSFGIEQYLRYRN